MIERCLLCEREWHVSVFRELKPYYCPKCTTRQREETKPKKRKSTRRSRRSR